MSLKVALALAGVCLAGRAQAQTVVVGPQAASMALMPGAQVTVPIVADLAGSGGASLGSATLRLHWNPGVLAFRGVSGGALGQPALNADSAGGSLRAAVANPAGVIGQPVLMNATFAIIGAPGVSDTLRLDLQELTRAGTFTDLLPIGIATTSHLCVSTGLLGDLDADAAVTSFDALVILTNAVGLPIAPYTTVNGDVDGDGQVTTRDALIVLTYAVELPVDGFRVGAINPGACSVQYAASVRIQPRNAEVSVGDQFPLVATVRDSNGAAVQGVDLVWTSADPTVVTADGTGHLVGTRPGSAQVFAFAAPGLKDSATVTVGSARHVWWVNPVAAALNGGVELGSQTRPFSSIGQALARAAANDSVIIAPSTYGEVVHFARPLTLVGDSNAAGAAIIRNPAGPGIAVDSLPGGGVVRIDHLHIDDSQGGVHVQGGPGGVVSLARLAITRSRAKGITVGGVDRLVLDHSVVQGAVGEGIGASGVPVVRLHAVGVDAVEQMHMGPEVPPVGVRVANADSLVAESLAVTGASVLVDTARIAHFTWFQSTGAPTSAIRSRVDAEFTLDSAAVSEVQQFGVMDPLAIDVLASAVGLDLARGATARVTAAFFDHNPGGALSVRGGDSVLVSGVQVQNSPYGNSWDWFAALFQGQRRVVLERSLFQDNADAAVIFWQDTVAMHATVDTTALALTRLVVHRAAQFDLHRSTVSNTQHHAAVLLDTVVTATLDRLDQHASTVQADFYDPHASGLYAVEINAADSVQLHGLLFHDNPFGALLCRGCRAVAADSSSFLRNGQFTGYLPYGRPAAVTLEGPVLAKLYGIQVDGGGSAGLWLHAWGLGAHLTVDSSTFVGDSMSLVRVDQPSYLGTDDTLLVRRSHFRGRNHSGYGVEISSVLAGITVRSSTFDSTTVGVSVYSSGATLIRANTFTGVGMEALQASYQYPMSNVVFDNNKVTCADPAASDAIHLIRVSGAFTRNAIAGCLRGFSSWSDDSGMNLNVFADTVSRDSTYTSNLIDITGQYTEVFVAGNVIHGGRGTGLSLLGQIVEARVDSNTVQGILGDGIVLGGSIASPVQMIYNVIADNDADGLWTEVPVAGRYNTVVRNKQEGAAFVLSPPSTFDFGNFVGNGHYGVFKASGPGSVAADSSYWGRTIGPRCMGLCTDSAMAGGDSVGVVPYVAFLPFDTAWVALAPPDPGPPAPAPVFRVPRPRVALPARAGARPAALPASRPRPAAAVTPRRVQP